MAGGEKARPSFSRKRSKKLLSLLSRTLPQHTPKETKVFWFFFQKRTAFLTCTGQWLERRDDKSCKVFKVCGLVKPPHASHRHSLGRHWGPFRPDKPRTSRRPALPSDFRPTRASILARTNVSLRESNSGPFIQQVSSRDYRTGLISSSATAGRSVASPGLRTSNVRSPAPSTRSPRQHPTATPSWNNPGSSRNSVAV